MVGEAGRRGQAVALPRSLWRRQNDKDAAPRALAVAAVAYAATIGCSRFTAVWNQVIPSSTAVIAAPRTAIVGREYGHRGGKTPQQPVTAVARDKDARQGRRNRWSHLDAHRRCS